MKLMKKSKLKQQLYGAVFYTHDIDAVEEYYEKLGFELEYREEDSYISFLLPAGGRLGIKLASEEREHPGYQAIQVEVDDVAACRNLIGKIETQVYQDTRVVEEWGTYFEVLDPDDNKITFVQFEDE
jgi:predicted enzyme related to lactoylglutathione lyase